MAETNTSFGRISLKPGAELQSLLLAVTTQGPARSSSVRAPRIFIVHMCGMLLHYALFFLERVFLHTSGRSGRDLLLDSEFVCSKYDFIFKSAVIFK